MVKGREEQWEGSRSTVRERSRSSAESSVLEEMTLLSLEHRYGNEIFRECPVLFIDDPNGWAEGIPGFRPV
ncbi:hypothetical protein [Aminivibrio sp.]|uniref:hypothetical protein n=1 Tax=Aminivibrio sp. TaxID=1872489 RepID=UPI00345E9709